MRFPGSAKPSRAKARRSMSSLDVSSLLNYAVHMQRLLFLLLVASTAVAGWFAYQNHVELSAKDALIAALTAERDAARNADKSAREDTAPMRENIERLTAERDRLKAEVPPAAIVATVPAKPLAATKPDDSGKSMMSGFAKMFQSEDGKKMLRSQTAMVVKMQYADLAKKLNLSPQETELVMGLLSDRQVAGAADGFAAFSGETMDEAKLKAAGEKATASRTEHDAKLKAALGEERFKELESYDRTIGERMMMTQLEPQFTSAGTPLEPAQKNQLIQIMTDERLKSPKTAFDPSNKDPGAVFNALKDDAMVDQWMQGEQDFQRRVLQAATKTLSPDQINTLQQGFQQQSEMQKFGLKMSREMFKGGGKTDGAAIPAIPAPR